MESRAFELDKSRIALCYAMICCLKISKKEVRVLLPKPVYNDGTIKALGKN